MIVNQAENYTQDLHYKIPKDWAVQNAPSGNMESDVWMKAMVNFKTVYVANKLNPQVLFYDGHISHFDDRDIHNLRSNHIKPFILKVGESGNDQPHDNGPNLKLKGLCVQARMNWQRQYGTLKFTSAHMNDVMVEKWRYFQLSLAPVVTNYFKKKNPVPLNPSDEDTNTQVCLAAA